MALPIAQYTSMPLPTAVSEQDEGGRTVGGVAIEAAVVSISKKPKARKRGECTGDKKKRAGRTCKRCKANKEPTAKHAEGGTRVTARQSVNSSTQLGRRDRHSRTSMRRAARRQRRRRRSIRLPKASSRNRVKLVLYTPYSFNIETFFLTLFFSFPLPPPLLFSLLSSSLFPSNLIFIHRHRKLARVRTSNSGLETVGVGFHWKPFTTSTT